MNKVPCGGFELDKNFLGINKDGELSLVSGNEGKAYQQLVTDGTGKATWEDRLAYEDKIVYLDSVEFMADPDYATIINSFEIENGKTYHIIFDGETFKSTAYTVESPFGTAVSLGNASFMGTTGGNNEPFFVYNLEERTHAISSKGSHVISVFTETVKKLDEKFMPVLTSPNGKKFKITVDDSGTISATEVTT